MDATLQTSPGVFYSELYQQSLGLVQFSPNGCFIAAVVDHRLTIRDIQSLEIRHLFTCRDKIDQIEWSCDSQYVLCAIYSRALVQVWSVEQPEWTCRITEGVAGLTYARWSSDGRHILTTADFNLHMTIWSLVNRSQHYIRNPKFGKEGVVFSHDSKYMAALIRSDCKDYIEVYFCETWERVKSFQLETVDAVGIEWTYDNVSIVVRDTVLHYLFLVYSLDGRLLSRFNAYQHALGIRNTLWSPCGQFFAVASYDSCVRIFNHVTWKVLSEYDHNETPDAEGLVAFEEVTVENTETQDPRQLFEQFSSSETNSIGVSGAISKNTTIDGTSRQQYVIVDAPYRIPQIKFDPTSPNPKIGVNIMGWSADSRFLATREDSKPNTVWIWETRKLQPFSLITHKMSVRAFKWNPVHCRLAICTGNSRVYLWSPDGASWVDISSARFSVKGLRWSPNGDCLILLGKEKFCCCYFE